MLFRKDRNKETEHREEVDKKGKVEVMEDEGLLLDDDDLAKASGGGYCTKIPRDSYGK